MPFVNGAFKRLFSWTAEQAAGKPISATEFDADGADVAAALSSALLRDGTGAPSADIPFAGHTVTGIRAGVAAGEPMEYGQTNALIAAAGGGINLLDNASFLVNQRGKSGTITLAAGVYGHDRWKAGAGGCTYTVSQAGADIAINISAGSLLQIVSALGVDAGTYTLQNAGTAQGRAYQGAVSTFGVNPQQVALGAGAIVTVEFGPGTVLQPQLILGATAKTFARKAVSEDFIICQATYETGFLRYLGGSSSSGSSNFYVRYRSPKAVSPATITISNFISSAALGNIIDNLADGFTQQVKLPSASAGDIACVFNWSASCEP